MKIKRLIAKKILNSRGETTIEVVINDKFKASAPSGASRGKYEVKPFPAKGVPVRIVNSTIAKKLIGTKLDSFESFNEVEKILFDYDKSKNISKLGGNTIIAIEFALLKALCKNEIWKVLNPIADEMPMPLGNCIGGGAHYKGNSVEIQEFLLVPRAERFNDAAIVNDMIYKEIGKRLKSDVRTDEGAWVTTLDIDEVLILTGKVRDEIVSRMGIDVDLGMDVAASELFRNNLYHYRNNKMLSQEEQVDYMNGLISNFNLKYVEDPLQEEDFDGFGQISCDMVCGDDLICTNLNRLKKAGDKINSVIVKPNQIGSLVKTKELVDYCLRKGIKPVVSHRSGETNDTTISHLAVAWECPYIKCGIFGKERVVKINELKNIEKQLI
jgi:enolase